MTNLRSYYTGIIFSLKNTLQYIEQLKNSEEVHTLETLENIIKKDITVHCQLLSYLHDQSNIDSKK